MKLPSSVMRSRKPAKSARTIFLSKKMLPVSVEEEVNVVLSPAFYWFREVVLPAKNPAQAKKLAPAYFDAIIPDGDYAYTAIAHTEAFWLFAYDADLIAEALDDAGLKPAQIRAVYFAQTECYDMPNAFRINENAILVTNEGTVSVVSSRYVLADENIETFLAHSARSRHKVNITLFRSGFLDEKQLGRLTLITIVFLVLYLGNFLQLRYQYKQQLIREAALQEHYKLPETSFQLKSLMTTLENTQKRQLKFRSVFRQLTQLALSEGEAVTALSMDEKKAELQILLSAPEHAETIKAALVKIAKVTSAKVKDNTFYVSIAYE